MTGIMTPVLYQPRAAESAVVEDTFFTPLRVGEASQVYFNFKNTSKMQSKLYSKFTVKDYPKGNEKNWFVQFCYSNICFLEDGESPLVIRPGQKEQMHITIWPYEGAKIGEKVKLVLEVYPSKDPKNKTSITFYAICVTPKEVKLTVDKKSAKVNGKDETLDAAPFVTAGRTLVPLRFVGSSLDAKIDWEPKDRKITFSLDQLSVFFWVGKAEAQRKIALNFTRTISLDTAPVIVNGRTFVPVRAVSELLGAEVGYEPKTRVITINFPPLPKE